jgi:hypothetical protein
MLLRRHRLLQNAVLSIYVGVALLVASVITLAIAVPTDSGDVSVASLALVLAGTGGLLIGLVFAARSIMVSQDAVEFEVRRALSLGS